MVRTCRLFEIKVEMTYTPSTQKTTCQNGNTNYCNWNMKKFSGFPSWLCMGREIARGAILRENRICYMSPNHPTAWISYSYLAFFAWEHGICTLHSYTVPFVTCWCFVLRYSIKNSLVLNSLARTELKQPFWGTKKLAIQNFCRESERKKRAREIHLWSSIWIKAIVENSIGF